MFKFNFLLLLFLGHNLIAQNDTIQKSRSFEGFEGFQINAKLISKNAEISNANETNLSYLFQTKQKPLNFTYKIDPKKYLNPNRPTRNFMYGNPPEDDVLVVKHFDGVNNSTKTFKTSQNLGTIESNTKFIRIEYRDFGLVDGDIVRIFLNEKRVDSNVHLNGSFYTLHINLKDTGYNKIDIQAVNQGYAGPNTAEFVVYDDKGNIIAHEAWNLQVGEIATLGIVKF